MKPIVKTLILLILFAGSVYAQDNQASDTSGYHSTSVNINQLLYWQRSDGFSAQDPFTGSCGGYFHGSNVLYRDGLIWGGYVQDPDPDKPQLRVNGTQYWSGLQPGNILTAGTTNQPAVAADPADTRFHIYRARKNIHTLDPAQLKTEAAIFFNIPEVQVTETQLETIRQQYLDDWQNWPENLGAPYYDRNRNGRWDADYDEPGIVGADQVLWYVVNDLDEAKSLSAFHSPSIGFEVQVTVWAYNYQAAALGQTVFKRYRIINKSGYAIKDMYLSIWSDPDVWDYGDDVCGCDTVRQMGFAYDAEVPHQYFGWFRPPLAVAYVLLQGPLVAKEGSSARYDFTLVDEFQNLAMSSFGYFTPGNLWIGPTYYYSITLEQYNMLRGFIPTDDLVNPTPFYVGSGSLAGQPTKFPVSGDPVTDSFGQISDIDGQGYNVGPGDRRMWMNSGPFDMAASEEQEIVFAMVGGLGEDRLEPVKQLQDYAPLLHDYYKSLVDFEAPIGAVPGMGKYALPDANTFILGPNYPNPFNGLTTFRIQVFADMEIKLDIFDMLGQRVNTVYDGMKEKGDHLFIWDGKSERGFPVSSGIYLARVQSGAQIQWQKMIYLK